MVNWCCHHFYRIIFILILMQILGINILLPHNLFCIPITFDFSFLFWYEGGLVKNMMELESVGVMNVAICIITMSTCSKNLWIQLLSCFPFWFRSRFSRYGTQLQLPPNFYELFPNVNIDGEVWYGRGNFLESQLIKLSPLKVSMLSFR